MCGDAHEVGGREIPLRQGGALLQAESEWRPAGPFGFGLRAERGSTCCARSPRGAVAGAGGGACLPHLDGHMLPLYARSAALVNRRRHVWTGVVTVGPLGGGGDRGRGCGRPALWGLVGARTTHERRRAMHELEQYDGGRTSSRSLSELRDIRRAAGRRRRSVRWARPLGRRRQPPARR